jgi:hypothetical protein
VTNFTVETVMAPIRKADWGQLRRVTDLLPGTILLEDPEEPMLVIPMDVPTQQAAAIFAQGVMTVLGLEIKWGRVYRTESCDLDYRGQEPAVEVAWPSTLVPAWLEDADDTERARQLMDA